METSIIYQPNDDDREERGGLMVILIRLRLRLINQRRARVAAAGRRQESYDSGALAGAVVVVDMLRTIHVASIRRGDYRWN